MGTCVLFRSFADFDEKSHKTTCLCLKYIKFCFYNLEHVGENKNRRRWTSFGFNNDKKIPIYFVKLHFFSFSKPRVVYLRPFLSSLLFHNF